MMKSGAFVMLDALGFKGIWGRHDPAGLIAKLRGLRDDVEATKERVCQELKAGDGGEAGQLASLDVDVRFLSDTIVMGVSGNSEGPAADRTSLLVASFIASHIVALAAKDEPRLAMRGCLSLGTFLMEDNFIVGRAVDDAAVNMQLAEGAFAWFAPSAKAELSKVLPAWQTFLASYDVPLKGGSTYRTPAIVPFVDCDSLAERKVLIKAILGTFVSGDVGVEVKRQNTFRFLDRVSTRLDHVERSQKRSTTHDLEATPATTTSRPFELGHEPHAGNQCRIRHPKGSRTSTQVRPSAKR